MKCLLSIEVRYLKHKLSMNTKHFEEDFAVVYDLGEYDYNVVKNIIDRIVGRPIKDLKERRLCVAIPKEVLKILLKKLGIDLKLPDESYYYLVVIECG